MCTSLAEQSQLSLGFRTMHSANPTQDELTRSRSDSLVMREECQWRIDHPWLEGTSDPLSEPRDYHCNSLVDVMYSRTQYWVLLSQMHIRFCPRRGTLDEQFQNLDDEYYSNSLKSCPKKHQSWKRARSSSRVRIIPCGSTGQLLRGKS